MTHICEHFENLKKAVIDSSSIIYMKKAAFFDVLKDHVDLCTISEVVQETGFRDLNITIHASSEPGASIDEKVLFCAQKNACPVISEDKKILLAARQQGLGHFNALVLVHFLLFKRVIDEAQHQAHFFTLLGFARYGPDVLGRGQEIYEKVQDYLKKGG